MKHAIHVLKLLNGAYITTHAHWRSNAARGAEACRSITVCVYCGRCRADVRICLCGRLSSGAAVPSALAKPMLSPWACWRPHPARRRPPPSIKPKTIPQKEIGGSAPHAAQISCDPRYLCTSQTWPSIFLRP